MAQQYSVTFYDKSGGDHIVVTQPPFVVPQSVFEGGDVRTVADLKGPLLKLFLEEDEIKKARERAVTGSSLLGGGAVCGGAAAWQAREGCGPSASPPRDVRGSLPFSTSIPTRRRKHPWGREGDRGPVGSRVHAAAVASALARPPSGKVSLELPPHTCPRSNEVQVVGGSGALEQGSACRQAGGLSAALSSVVASSSLDLLNLLTDCPTCMHAPHGRLALATDWLLLRCAQTKFLIAGDASYEAILPPKLPVGQLPHLFSVNLSPAAYRQIVEALGLDESKQVDGEPRRGRGGDGCVQGGTGAVQLLQRGEVQLVDAQE